jgi:cytochrome P450
MGFWVLTRYDDVTMALRDPRFGRAGFDELLRARFGESGFDLSMLFRDPPDHTRLRMLVSKAFTPRVVEGLRPRIQQVVDGLLDAIHPARAMDVIADLAYPLPVTVICEMLGVPVGDRARFRQWSEAIARSLDAIAMPGRESGLDPTRPVIATCGSGVSAAVLALGLYLLGRREAAVYDGSWTEWGGRSDTPVEP